MELAETESLVKDRRSGTVAPRMDIAELRMHTAIHLLAASRCLEVVVVDRRDCLSARMEAVGMVQRVRDRRLGTVARNMDIVGGRMRIVLLDVRMSLALASKFAIEWDKILGSWRYHDSRSGLRLALYIIHKLHHGLEVFAARRFYNLILLTNPVLIPVFSPPYPPLSSPPL